jgi:hypothetical protein
MVEVTSELNRAGRWSMRHTRNALVGLSVSDVVTAMMHVSRLSSLRSSSTRPVDLSTLHALQGCEIASTEGCDDCGKAI